ncbi:hypothetical protein DXG03_008846, partial [Asterophora parasitica]
MAALFVGPMPVDQFLREFVSPTAEEAPPLPLDHFDKMPKNVKKEKDMYQPF